MKHSSPLQSQCPLCGKNNACAMAEGSEANECWCFTARISERLLATLPESARGRSCVCRSCIAEDASNER
ncbi:MAG: cysteine-rich CWC family protein [Pseudomonadota bacterium]